MDYYKRLLNALLKTIMNQILKEILESSHELSIHKTRINYLMAEVCKYLHGLSPELMTDISTLWKNITFAIFVYLALKIHVEPVSECM